MTTTNYQQSQTRGKAPSSPSALLVGVCNQITRIAPSSFESSLKREISDLFLDCEFSNGISIAATFSRIEEYMAPESMAYTVALIYLDRMIRKMPSLLSAKSLRRMISLALLLAFKFYTGKIGISLSNYSDITMIPIRDLEEGELFVSAELLDWNFTVEEEYFHKYQEKLNTKIQAE